MYARVLEVGHAVGCYSSVARVVANKPTTLGKRLRVLSSFFLVQYLHCPWNNAILATPTLRQEMKGVATFLRSFAFGMAEHMKDGMLGRAGSEATRKNRTPFNFWRIQGLAKRRS